MTLLPLADETPMPAVGRVAAAGRAEAIRTGMLVFADTFAALREDIAAAYRARDWDALGYDSWDAYVVGEFGTDRLPTLEREERQELAASLRAESMSTRAIASVLGVGHQTVMRDLSAGGPGGPPAEVTGADGKTYPAARPAPPVPEAGDPSCFDGEVLDAELVDEDENLDPPAPQELWSYEERSLVGQLQAGETVVVNFQSHGNLIHWATRQGLFERIDRRSDWGNPYEIPGDGDRTTVIASYAEGYLPRKLSLLPRLPELRGKALGCWCAPLPCHGDVLKTEAER